MGPQRRPDVGAAARGEGLEPSITGPEPVVLPITPPPNGWAFRLAERPGAEVRPSGTGRPRCIGSGTVEGPLQRRNTDSRTILRLQVRMQPLFTHRREYLKPAAPTSRFAIEHRADRSGCGLRPPEAEAHVRFDGGSASFGVCGPPLPQWANTTLRQ